MKKRLYNCETSNPKVSVVLCTYNDEKFIAETIQSVLGQKYTNFEFIIWNDGSTDSTEEIIKSFRDERIRHFFHENTGVGMAAQLACRMATGKYIARIDGDDVCLPERLQMEVDFLEKHPDYVVVSSGVYYIDEKGRKLGQSFPATSNDVLQSILKHDSPIVHPASMFRTETFRQAGGYVGVKQSLDHILFGRLRKYGKIKNLPIPLLQYRLRETSLSHRISGSGYDSILHAYRNKIIDDEIVNEKDIDIYNSIFCESRKNKDAPREKELLYRKTVEERLYSILKIGGNKRATFIVCALKNLYCRLRCY